MINVKRFLKIPLIAILIAGICALGGCQSTESSEDIAMNAESQESTYTYSEYLDSTSVEDELLEWFEEYNIRFYDGDYVDEFSDMDLPMPETMVVDFPSHTIRDDAYMYTFEDETQLRVYIAAYMVYLMNLDYAVTEIEDNVYRIDDSYYLGFGLDEGEYFLMILEV